MSEVIKRPTRVRYLVLAMALGVAVLLYLDRFCLSNAARTIREDLGFDNVKMAALLGAFYLPYAFGQIPSGYLVDRFGPRRTLSVLMFLWSTSTALLGLAQGAADFYLYRFCCGLFEAGGYPACASIIKRWIPPEQRAFASGVVSIGGRLGGTITPWLTAALMAMFAVRMPEYFSWRPTLILFGGSGVLLAGLFWLFFRDNPAEHPTCNRAEIELIGDPIKPTAFHFPWLGVLLNRSLWVTCFIQFFSNFGQVFFGTLFNDYLIDVQMIDDGPTRGWMVSLVFFMCLPGLLIGGWMTDAAVKRFGDRWGIALPMSLPRIAAGLSFLCVPLLMRVFPEPSMMRACLVVGVLGAVQFFADLSLPSMWAFNLMVGGRVVGLVLGWGNMWGNFGGYRSPNDIQAIVNAYGWDAVFITCGAAFLMIGFAAFFVDSRQKIVGVE